jgi:MYXO-CTERM domain-containing protein
VSSDVAVLLGMRRLAALFTFSLLAGSSTPAFADIEPEPPPKQEKGNDGCSVSQQSDAMLGLAVLALLVSGVMLRRRSPDATPDGIV